MTISIHALDKIQLHKGSEVKPFTGKPSLRKAAMPSNPARIVNGKLMQPSCGLDWLLFGIVPPFPNPQGLFGGNGK